MTILKCRVRNARIGMAFQSGPNEMPNLDVSFKMTSLK